MAGDEFARRAWDRHQRTHQQLLTASLDSAREALRAMLLVNGAASIALLAFLAAATGIDDPARQERFAVLATNALQWFAFGTLAALIATGLAYLTTGMRASSVATRLTSEDPPYFTETPESERYGALAMGFNIGAVLAGLAALGFFLTGILQVRPMF